MSASELSVSATVIIVFRATQAQAEVGVISVENSGLTVESRLKKNDLKNLTRWALLCVSTDIRVRGWYTFWVNENQQLTVINLNLKNKMRESSCLGSSVRGPEETKNLLLILPFLFLILG